MIDFGVGLMVHISFLLIIGMIIMVVRKCQKSQIRTAFICTIGIIGTWCLSELLIIDILALTGIINMFLVDTSYIGLCLTPVALLYLGKVILHPDWKPHPLHLLFAVIPVISIIIIFTNNMHNLFFVQFALSPSEIITGPYFVFHSIYSYGCIAVSIFFMIISSARNSGFFSKQSLFVILGLLITLIPNVLYSFDLMDMPYSISTSTFTITLLCFFIAFYKYRFISSMPINIQQVVDLVSDGYLVVDKQFDILYYNKALFNLLPNDTIVKMGDKLQSFIEACLQNITYETFLELHKKAVTEQRTVSEEGHILGETYVSIEITPVIQYRMLVGSIIILKDITQARLLVESTRANRAKNEFLSRMSHEMRTPMNAILNMTELAKNTSEPEKRNDWLDKVSVASRHLLNLIDDVLDISKIEEKKINLVYYEFNLKKLIEEIADSAEFDLKNKKHALSVETDSEIPEKLSGDWKLLSQVIKNLLSNACKFTPEQGLIKIKAFILESENENYTIQIEVTDNGVGIPKDKQSKIFIPFEQADGGIDRQFDGVGLGLTISKNIIELMGGEIWVESEPGKGSTFAFTVKLRITSDEDSAIPIYNYEDKTAMLVDDVIINREIVMALLEDTKIGIDCAENGQQALDLFRADPKRYNIIFMDINMPVMDGVEATRRIRALGIEGANVPIVAITANTLPDEVEKYREAGMTAHIGKPVDMDDLWNKTAMYII